MDGCGKVFAHGYYPIGANFVYVCHFDCLVAYFIRNSLSSKVFHTEARRHGVSLETAPLFPYWIVNKGALMGGMGLLRAPECLATLSWSIKNKAISNFQTASQCLPFVERNRLIVRPKIRLKAVLR